MDGEAPDVEFVNDQVFHGNEGPGEVAPVEVVLHHPGFVVLAGAVLHAPLALARYRPGIGVQKVLGLVEDQAFLRVPGAVHPEGVLELLDVQLEDDHGIHVPDAVPLWEGENGVGLGFPPVEEQKFNGGGAVGVDREVHAAGDSGGAVDFVKAWPHVETVQMVHGNQVDGAGQSYRRGFGNGRLGRDAVLCFHRELLPRRSGDCRIRSHYTTRPQICHNFFPIL